MKNTKAILSETKSLRHDIGRKKDAIPMWSQMNINISHFLYISYFLKGKLKRKQFYGIG